MAHIQVYFNDALTDEVELTSEVTTIGRSIESDIKIDNAAVSANHAKIIKDGKLYVIEDNASKNGIFVNGERVSRRALFFGDEIKISKHTLKMTAIKAQTTSPVATSHDTHKLEQGATVEVNVADLGELLKQRQAKCEAYLLLPSAVQRRSKYPLTKLNFKIGKARDCDIYTSGWFAPRVSARVVHRNDGYYIMPEKRGRVRVNGIPVSAPRQLEDGDGVMVGGLSMMFYNRPREKP